MKRTLVVLLVLVLAIPLAALAAAAWFLNGDAVKTRLAEQVRRATGRELTIAGPVTLAWSLVPTLALNDVSLGNPRGFADPQMAHAARIDATVAVLPLLERRVDIRRIAIVSPTIRLARDAAGVANWDFRPPPVPTTAQPAPSQPGGVRLTTSIGAVEITDATIGWGTQTVTSPRLVYDPGSGRVTGTLATTVGALPLTATGQLDFATLLHGPAAMEARIEAPGLAATASGTLAPTGAAELQLGVQSPDLGAAGLQAGLRLPAFRALTATAALSLDRGRAALTGLHLTSAQGDVAGDLAIADAGRLSLRGTLTSASLDLDALTPPTLPSAPLPSAPASPAPPAVQPTRVIPDTRLPLAALRGADADLQLTAASLRVGHAEVRAVQTHAVLQNGMLRLDPLSMAIGPATAHATLQVDAAAAPPTLHVTVDAPGLPFGAVLALAGTSSASAGTLDIRADLTGAGDSVRAIAGTLAGHAGLALVDGKIDNDAIGHVAAGLLRTVNLPLEPGGSTTIRCAALRADADGGIVGLRPIVLDTSKLALDGSGSVDLRDESIDLHLRPQLRLGGGLSVPLLVRGTLATPKAALDPGAIAAGRVGIVLGGGAPPDNCGPALASARDGQAGVAAAAPPPARAIKPADLLRGLLR